MRQLFSTLYAPSATITAGKFKANIDNLGSTLASSNEYPHIFGNANYINQINILYQQLLRQAAKSEGIEQVA